MTRMAAGRPLPRIAPVRRERHVVTVVAWVVLVVAPLVPGALATGSALMLLAVPVESLLFLLLLVVTPWRPARWLLAGGYGLLVVVAALLAGLDLGFRFTVDRAFVPSADAGQLIAAYGVVRDAVGPVTAVLLVALIVVAAAAAAWGCAWAALRVAATMRRPASEGRRSRHALAALTAVWVCAALVGAHLAPGVPAAASDAIGAIGSTSAREAAAIRQEAEFAAAERSDPYRDVPSARILSALRGKDVVVAFIESYGRTAVQGTSFSEGVDRVLRAGDAQLTRDGYSARSAFLTSPTFGGVSWLAHSTLQTGLWIDSQATYDHVVGTDRLTLSGAFRSAGWRTVSDVPSDTEPWPVGSDFYHYDEQLNADNVGYRGPTFSYARVPDQYTWEHFYDSELAGPHASTMAEIDFVSSHTPWTPLPHPVPPADLGDGSVFDPQPAEGRSPADVWRDPADVQRLYGESIQYSLGAMFSFLHEHDEKDLVLIVLGDHQPARIVSGRGADHDVPIAIISKDPQVLDRISSWHWDAGTLPSPDAAVWPMDAFRDRFFSAFSSR
ncbi:MAG: CDP-alcohol phosphatidyltransferase [Microbacterium sp.]|uniref:CDP-alcohol phosphatidyltransferase n=1 Tax=Microbacterium sp. TaxID=51671 RepID=UPI001ACDF3FA|nr:CDP-alcohol phosphatidyltransferase [Microbacterium sp.]MBN9152420.1 CDP-alcohol phosphatidyltransferase [Microbacterium sp.]